MAPNDIRWESYFAYYTDQCDWALSIDQGEHLAAETHDDIVQIAGILQSDCDKDTAQKELGKLLQQKQKPDTDAVIDGSIKLVTRLLTMVNIGALPSEISSQRCLEWDQGPLKACIHNHFDSASRSASKIASKDVVLGSELTARHMMRVARIVIIPTDNILDHLRLVEDDKKLCVFHHISFLRYMEAINRYGALLGCSTYAD